MSTKMIWFLALVVMVFFTGIALAENPFGDKLMSGLKKAGKAVNGEEKSSEKSEPSQANAPAGDFKTPVVLDFWRRYHTNITTFEFPTKTPEGSTNYDKLCWVPKMDVVVQLADPESDDLVIIQHYKGTKPWGDPIKVPVGSSVTKREGRNYSLVTVSSKMDDKFAITEPGVFTAKVSYKQTSRDKLHENLATFIYTVKNYTQAWTSKGKVKGFYVDHDFRIGEAWLYLLSDGKVEVWTWFKYDRDGQAKVREGRMRCFQGDKKIDFYESPTQRTEVSYQEYREKNKNEQTTWGLWYWWVPTIDGMQATEYLKKNPGKYRCVLTQDGEVSREFVFTVGGNGQVVRTPLPGHPVIYGVEDSAPLKITFKKIPDLKYDPKAFKEGAYYNRK